MGKFQRNCVIFVSIIILAGAGFFLPIVPVLAYPTYPQTGIIAMWTGGSPPSGWETVSTLNGRFVLGASSGDTPGTTGGTSTHSHTYSTPIIHGHGYTSSTGVTHSHTYVGGGPTALDGSDGTDITTLNPNSLYGTSSDTPTHSHSVSYTGTSTCYTASSSHLPPYQTVTYIKKISTAALYPAGLIVISTNGVIPSGWVRCDGTSGTPDLRGDFLMGSIIPGSTGGSETHRHTYTTVPIHTHSLSYSGGSHNHGAYGGTMTVKDDDLLTVAYDVVTVASGTTASSTYSHAHSIPSAGSSTCYTTYQSNLPQYVAVDFLMSTSATDALPEGIVAMWDGSVSSIPYGWASCDGTSGTTNLVGRFVRGRNSEAIGTLGGSQNHQHSYSTMPSHTHSMGSTSVSHYHGLTRYGGIAVGGAPLIGDGFLVYTASGTRSTTSSTFSHSHYVNSVGSSSGSTGATGHYPPYALYRFIQCNDYEADGPIFTSTPIDRNIEYGYYTGESVSWTATDDHPDTYTVELLGSGTVAGPTTWGSGSSITYNIPDGFAIGSYTYEIEVLDKYGRPNTDTVTISVVDSTDPIITGTPAPLTVEYGYTGQSFSWTATDLNPDFYQIEKLDTGTVVGPTGWSSGGLVTYNIPDGLGVGTYTYLITFQDDYYNTDTDTVDFTVEDTTKPTFTEIPDDITVEYGYSSLNVSWTGTDPYPLTYTVDQLDVGIVEGPLSWASGSEINYTIPTGLGVGTYTFTMNITDNFENYQTDSMNFTVEDTTGPMIGNPASDLVVEIGYTGQSFTWGVTDPYACNYSITLDGVGTIVDWIPWSSGTDIVYSIPDGFSEGVYTYTLNVTDDFGNHANHVVTLTVEADDTDPVITSAPDDIFVEPGYSGQSLAWTATDLFPSHYILELQGTGIVVESTSWTSGNPVTYEIPNGFSAGTYIYTITFYDSHGNEASDSVTFTVEAPPKPTIPGFNVPVILTIGVCSIIGTILIVKKRYIR